MKNTKIGLSLIEAIVAIVIFAIAVVAALSYLVYCDRYARQADARITAANFTRETIENLYKRGYYDPLLGVGDSDPIPSGSVLRRYPTSPSRSYAITGRDDYKLITVTVTWNQ